MVQPLSKRYFLEKPQGVQTDRGDQKILNFFKGFKDNFSIKRIKLRLL